MQITWNSELHLIQSLTQNTLIIKLWEKKIVKFTEQGEILMTLRLAVDS